VRLKKTKFLKMKLTNRKFIVTLIKQEQGTQCHVVSSAVNVLRGSYTDIFVLCLTSLIHITKYLFT